MSVLSRCKGIGEPTLSHKPLHFRSSFGRRTPRSMRRALDGMTDPQVANWQYLGLTFKSENNSDSREAQGMTTDGTKWYLCSNGSKRIIVFDARTCYEGCGSNSGVWRRHWQGVASARQRQRSDSDSRLITVSAVPGR